MSLLELFCHVDDFCQTGLPSSQADLLTSGRCQRRRRHRLSPSELMTILIWFHQSHYRDFKAFYELELRAHHRHDFPGLLSYQRFVECIPSVQHLVAAYLRHCLGHCTGVSYMDSTALAVCHPKRTARHKVFAHLAHRGKTALGWFFGFKLHLVCNDRGELLDLAVTPGNRDDRAVVPELVQHLFGKVFADRGYLSQKLFTQVRTRYGVQILTNLRKNMPNRLVPLRDKQLLGKRMLVESVIDQLKHGSQIEHSRHRSPVNFAVNLLCGLIAYCHQPKKPTLNWRNVTPPLP